MAINQNGLTLDFLDGLGGTLRVEEVGSGLTAGTWESEPPSRVDHAVVGSDLNLLVSNQTQLSQLFGGIGIPNASMMTIRQNGRDYNVNTAGMETVEDLINGIEASGARVQASIDPTGKYFFTTEHRERNHFVGR